MRAITTTRHAGDHDDPPCGRSRRPRHAGDYDLSVARMAGSYEAPDRAVSIPGR